MFNDSFECDVIIDKVKISSLFTILGLKLIMLYNLAHHALKLVCHTKLDHINNQK